MLPWYHTKVNPGNVSLVISLLQLSVALGAFLGIFPGRLRYVDQKPPRAIKGPVDDLWLDHSETTGKLNQVRVAKPGEKKNVCLAWEGVKEVKGKETY